MIHVTVDGARVAVPVDASVLDAVRQSGGDLPTLCHRSGLPPEGSCRLCAVHVDWNRLPVPACDTRCRDGMAITTGGEVLEMARREVVRMLMQGHPAPCRPAGDPRGPCELELLAGRFDIPSTGSPSAPDTAHPAISVNLAACIGCGRCVRACGDVQGHRVIGWQGLSSPRLSFSGGDSLAKSDCVACGECVADCPTGALSSTPAPAPHMEQVETICPYCGVGCGITCHTADGRVLAVTSNPEHPSNRGRLCVKGRFGLDFVHHPERLSTPLIRKDGAAKPSGPESFREATWEEALSLTVERLSGITRKHGGQAVGGLGSAKCTNEDNYLFQKWMRAGLASNNVDHCARLCHSSSVVALGTMLGSGAATNPNTDFTLADVVFLIGTNTLANHPVIGTFIREGHAAGHHLIVADPRRVGLAAEADLHLAHRPGSDAWLINGIARKILDAGHIDEDYIATHTEGFEAYRNGLLALDMDEVEQTTGVSLTDIRTAARMMGEAKGLLTGWGMGLTQHVAGSLNCMAVAAMHLMTGNLGRPGAGLNPLRGQSNVQGASDMGVLPNVFPGYQPVADEAVRDKFAKAWACDLSDTPGLTVVEMFQAARAGKLLGMHVMGENPALSDPNLGHVEEALSGLEFLAVQDVFFSETAAWADIVLPAASVLERAGSITNTERRIQPIRPVFPPPGRSRPDGDILADLLARTGHAGDSGDPAHNMDEMAALTPSHGGLSSQRIEAESLIWPVPGPAHPGTPILHADGPRRGKGRFLPPKLVPPAEVPDTKYPHLLTTGRILGHYQTGTLSRRSEVLDALVHEPWAEIHPDTLRETGIDNGQNIRLVNPRGTITLTARATESALPGVVFVPFHFAEAPVNRLVHDSLDPQAKIPEYKCVAVRIEVAG
ncbi:MAG: formate dehydrogenase subunit alpha [Leptospirillia bacterium]